MWILLFSALPQGGDGRVFSCEMSAEAPPERIWQIWTDVPNWHRWDSGLRSAVLQGPFVLDARGELLPDQGPASSFRVSAFEVGQSYTLRIPLPGGSLELRRSLRAGAPGQTIFRHEVRFRGLTGGVFARIMGRRYRAMLPGVLEHIRLMAEQKS